MKPKRTLGIGLAVVTALLTAACAAGQQAATAYEQPTLDGVNGDVGAIHIRGMLIDAPTGPHYSPGDGTTVKLVLVNTGNKPDVLIGVTSPDIADWGTFKTTADAEAVLAPTPAKHKRAKSTSSSASGSASTARASRTAGSSSAATSSSPATSSSAAPAPSTSAASSSLPVPSRQITIAPGARVSWGTPESTGALVLLSFSREVWPGTTIPLTLRFAQAGSITLQVPVALSGSPNTSPIPAPSTSSVEG